MKKCHTKRFEVKLFCIFHHAINKFSISLSGGKKSSKPNVTSRGLSREKKDINFCRLVCSEMAWGLPCMPNSIRSRNFVIFLQVLSCDNVFVSWKQKLKGKDFRNIFHNKESDSVVFNKLVKEKRIENAV